MVCREIAKGEHEAVPPVELRSDTPGKPHSQSETLEMAEVGAVIW